MILGIVSRMDKKDNSSYFYVYETFKKICDELGYILIPIISEESLNVLVDICDGLIIPGNGHDIDPKHYNDDVNPETNIYDIDEFELDKSCILKFNEKGKKILGICAGHQSINVAFGGSLNQHIEGHRLLDGSLHDCILEDDSILNDIYESKEIKVNSTHHQCIKDVAEGFKVSVLSKDGVIEAIEKGNVLGVQWHPEKLLDYNFFKKFFER